MAHHIAEREFDYVAFERDYQGRLQWTYTPRTLANAKQKAKREGYTNFFIAWKDQESGGISPVMEMLRYVYDEDNRKWIYS